MKLATFTSSKDNTTRAGDVAGDLIHAFAAGVTVAGVLAGTDSPERSGETWPLDDVTLLAPVPEPRAVYGIGLNYAKHVEETGGTKPEQPIVFVKVRGAVHRPAARSADQRSCAAWTMRENW